MSHHHKNFNRNASLLLSFSVLQFEDGSSSGSHLNRVLPDGSTFSGGVDGADGGGGMDGVPGSSGYAYTTSCLVKGTKKTENKCTKAPGKKLLSQSKKLQTCF